MQHNGKLAKVRALLAKAEDPAATEAETETYRAKAYELMAEHGIEQAMLNADKPVSDKPADRKFTVPNPWSMERIRLMNGLAHAMGCEFIHLSNQRQPGARHGHVFGYESDIARMELLYTSLLLQMDNELARTPVPYGHSPRAWRRSWLVGFVHIVTVRVKEAEARARRLAETQTTTTGRSTDLVLTDRASLVAARFHDAYPRRRSGGKTTVRGNGYGDGAAAGRRADIGGPRIGGSRRAIGNA